MKKVLLIATVQSHIGQFHKPLMKLLKANGWQIHVAARDNLNEKNGLQLEYPDKVFDIPFQRSPFDKRNIKAYKKLKLVLENEYYDVIHCNTPVGGVLGRLAARKYRMSGTLVYYTAHGFHFYKGAPKKNWILYYPVEKLASRFTDQLITITKEDYELALKKFNCPVSYIHGVGADSHKYHPIDVSEQKKRKKELALEGKIIVNVGELLPNKNQKTAIKAMKYIAEQYPDARLLIAGNGREKETLARMVKDMSLDCHVLFLGYTTELQKYLQICDAEIACSYREGLPLNVLEAMLCGKPVVASDNRGHRELIGNGENGYIVMPDDVKGFAEAVCRILEDPARYKGACLQKAKIYKDTAVQKELAIIYQL